jgi:hypothetical protein
MPWYTPNPTPGAAITSAWGNAVEDHCQPTFASLAALNSGWTDAPDGASAFCLDTRRTMRRRGGQWLMELQNVQGVMVNAAGPQDVSGNFVPPNNTTGAQLGTMGPYTLKGKRIYQVGLRGRFQMQTSTNKVLSLVLNATGTGADVPLGSYTGGNASFANGQLIVDASIAFPFTGCVVKQSWQGTLTTGGSDDQNLSVLWQIVLATPGVAFLANQTNLLCVDIGAAP